MYAKYTNLPTDNRYRVPGRAQSESSAPLKHPHCQLSAGCTQQVSSVLRQLPDDSHPRSVPGSAKPVNIARCTLPDDASHHPRPGSDLPGNSVHCMSQSGNSTAGPSLDKRGNPGMTEVVTADATRNFRRTASNILIL
ncbi:hypothetical protein DPMN_091389 [Dreissena polymorpha]|uniref:Uncharacterized protein n=1 Tax=Dreissena polymorpha TaxID=45954 RepID=A0A9D4L0G5_DREPO|nr:hypothetical protein DPMN_091389 [Dreissena polymorpha]